MTTKTKTKTKQASTEKTPATSIARAGFAADVGAKRNHKNFKIMPSQIFAVHRDNHARAALYSIKTELPELAKHASLEGDACCFRRDEVLRRMESFRMVGQEQAIKVYRTATHIPVVGAGYLRHMAALLAEVTGQLAAMPGMRDGLLCKADESPRSKEDQLGAVWANRAENERKDTTAIDDAWLINRLVTLKVPLEEIANRLDMSTRNVNKILSLLALSPSTQMDIHEGRISMGAALNAARLKGQGTARGPRSTVNHTVIRTALERKTHLPTRGLSAGDMADFLGIIAGVPCEEPSDLVTAWIEALKNPPPKPEKGA